MYLHPFLAFLSSIPLLLLLLPLWPTAVHGWPGLEALSNLRKRQYHHEIHLDESKHDEEFFNFVTRPDLDAPRWDIEIYDKDAVTPGYWFTAPYEEVSQSRKSPPWNAPHIYDSNGELVWSGAATFGGFSTFDFRKTNILGKEMLSLIYPQHGKAVIFDSSYEIHEQVDIFPDRLVEDKYGMNMHEFTTVENGTKALHLIRMPKKTSKENSMAIDYDGSCYADFNGFRELNVEDWSEVMTWDSEDHIGLDESYVTQEPVNDRCGSDHAWDYFHSNSIDKFPDGDYLVSGRRTNAIYRVSHKDGSIVWRVGGRKSDFSMNFIFSGQHAAKIREYNETHTVISFLDNAFGPGDPQQTHDASRGFLLSLDTQAMTATVITEYKHPEHLHAIGRGNVQMFPNGNAWICWVSRSLQSEHHRNGSLIMKAKFKAMIASYRTFKHDWVGRPNQPPDIHSASLKKNGKLYTFIHMSWNGATEIAHWNIYSMSEERKDEDKKLLTKVPKSGFETATRLDGFVRYVVAEAVDKNGKKLGESEVFKTHEPLDADFEEEVKPRPEQDLVNPIFAFLGGLFFAAIVLAIGWGVWKCCRRTGFARWRSGEKKQAYSPLFRGTKEEAELDDFLDGDEPGSFHDSDKEGG